MKAEQIAKLINATGFRFVDERELQNGIEDRVLKLYEIPTKREVILNPKDRIDFLCGTVGIEVKIAGPVAAVTRQLFRYAESDRIDGLILVTTRSSHKLVPNEILSKPVFVVHLLNSIF